MTPSARAAATACYRIARAKGRAPIRAVMRAAGIGRHAALRGIHELAERGGMRYDAPTKKWELLAGEAMPVEQLGDAELFKLAAFAREAADTLGEVAPGALAALLRSSGIEVSKAVALVCRLEPARTLAGSQVGPVISYIDQQTRRCPPDVIDALDRASPGWRPHAAAAIDDLASDRAPATKDLRRELNELRKAVQAAFGPMPTDHEHMLGQIRLLGERRDRGVAS